MSERVSEVPPGFVVGRKSNGRCIYSVEGKRALVEASLRPGVSVAKLAMTHGVNANLLRKWMASHKGGRSPKALTAAQVPALLPVIPVETRAKLMTHPSSDACMEIVVGAATIRLRGTVDAQQLRTVVDCLVRRV